MSSLGQALLAGVAPLVAIHLLRRGRTHERGRLRAILVAVLALPPLAFTVPTLLALPIASWVVCSVLCAAVAAVVRWRRGSATAAALTAAALAAIHGWAHTWMLHAFSPGCAAVWQQAGATRIDRDARIERSLFSGMQRGEIGVDVDAREEFAYASYAHGGHPQGVAKLPLRAQTGAARIEIVETGSGGLLFPRVEPSGERLFVADHADRQLYVLGGAPFAELARVDVGAEEPMGVAFDLEAARALVVDRTERRDAATPDQRAAGLLALALDDPGRRLARIPLPYLAGASEIVPVPGERRVIVTSDAFPTVAAVDLASGSSRAAMTYLPGVGGAAVDPVKRELYLTHAVGLVQVRGLDDLGYRRTLVAHGAVAVAVDATRGALYVGDGLGGRLRRIDAASGEVLGERRVGVRMRQMRVLGDGRLLTASACGVVALDPP